MVVHGRSPANDQGVGHTTSIEEAVSTWPSRQKEVGAISSNKKAPDSLIISPGSIPWTHGRASDLVEVFAELGPLLG